MSVFPFKNKIKCMVAFLVQEEQDIKALQAKNRKLGEALDQRQVDPISLSKNWPLLCSAVDNYKIIILAGYRR